MRKHLSIVALSAAALAMAFVACGENGTTDFSCATNADCQTGEICHPEAFFCVQTCTTSEDCPSFAKTCEAVSATVSDTVCKCSTDQLCAGDDGLGPDFACSDSFEICVPKCSSDLDCPTGQTCGANNECAPAAGQCSPACGAGQVCQNGTCVNETVSCSGTGQAACAYGQFCSSGTCAAPAEPTCSNIRDLDPQGGWDPRTWDPSNPAHNGPVIFSLERGTDTSYPCTDPTTEVIQVVVRAYRTDMDFPATKAELGGFFYVMVNGTRKDATGAVMRNSDYQPSGREATMRVNFCSPKTDSQIQTAFYFTNGNALCGTIKR